jgi:solute carrier family 6 GABA transporter-like protein 1
VRALGFGLFISALVVALILAETPDSPGAPRFLQKNMLLKKVYYIAFDSGNQLRRDLNLIIGLGKNWNLPFFWAPLLRYITGLVLAIVFSFAYPAFQPVKNDPMYIFGCIVAHFLLLCITLGFVVPK